MSFTKKASFEIVEKAADNSPAVVGMMITSLRDKSPQFLRELPGSG